MIAIIDYNAGNVQSVQFALQRLGVEGILTSDPAEIQDANKVIFPGVGEASRTMQYLKDRGLDQVIRQLDQPVLGICLGMQLLCKHSEEGDTPCLDIIPAQVRKFQSMDPAVKIPHMGWNTVRSNESISFLPELGPDAYVYFVHSYYVETGSFTVGETNYIHSFSSVIQKDNFYATQFHPEKSGTVGQTILKSFLEL